MPKARIATSIACTAASTVAVFCDAGEQPHRANRSPQSPALFQVLADLTVVRPRQARQATSQAPVAGTPNAR